MPKGVCDACERRRCEDCLTMTHPNCSCRCLGCRPFTTGERAILRQMLRDWVELEEARKHTSDE